MPRFKTTSHYINRADSILNQHYNLNHIKARCKNDSIILESFDDIGIPYSKARLREISMLKWKVEVATSHGKENILIEGNIEDVLNTIIEKYSYLIAL